MFSNTAYEALYRYLGLLGHSGSIEVLTSESFFKGAVIFIFAVCFLDAIWGYLSRYIFGNLVRKRNVPLSKVVKVILCLVVGISVLRAQSEVKIENFSGSSWTDNQYITGRLGETKKEYQVSMLFALLSGTAEEISKYATQVGDYLFGTEESSYLKGAHGFAKAIMLAGAATIEDEKLKGLIDSYTRLCIMKVFAAVKDKEESHINMKGMYEGNEWIDGLLAKIPLKKEENLVTYTCRDLKNDVRSSLKTEIGHISDYPLNHEEYRVTAQNKAMSSALNNYYKNKKEGYWGLHKGSFVPGTAGSVFQYLNRMKSWDSFLSLFGQSDLHGASEAADRAQKFSEMLARAPHIKGIAVMILILIFPWLIFPVVAGKWKILITWFWVYFSVCMWTPIWTVMYHIMNNLSKTSDVLGALGSLNDGISLYAADLVGERTYYLYSVFTMAQLLVPMATTGLVLYFAKPLLFETDSEQAPGFVDDAKSTVKNGAAMYSGASGGVSASVKGAP